MALTTQQHLDLVDAAIQQRLNGDAYEEYSEGGERFRGASLAQLYEIRTELRSQLASEGGIFSQLEPFG